MMGKVAHVFSPCVVTGWYSAPGFHQTTESQICIFAFLDYYGVHEWLLAAWLVCIFTYIKGSEWNFSYKVSKVNTKIRGPGDYRQEEICSKFSELRGISVPREPLRLSGQFLTLTSKATNIQQCLG